MENRNYYAFSRETPDALVARFQEALEAVRDEHAAILARYGLGR
jgi:hypothetical protein